MQKKMEAQEQKEKAADVKEQKRLAKKEAQAEEAAVSSQRKTTRAAAAQPEVKEPPQLVKEESTGKKLPMRGRPKKETGKGSITQFLSKKELAERSEGKSVAQAMEEAAEEHNAKPTAFGAQDLRSANQPKAVSGGIMRGYQLEGLYWLASLYENGLNGILADEMGLGKTIQTISFLAFLREKGINGPFLVVAPLSTLGNWIEEFARWAPTIPTVLYHGAPGERTEIRNERLKDQRSAKFPVLCTSYEICMNDRKHLQYFDWKYIIIVSSY